MRRKSKLSLSLLVLLGSLGYLGYEYREKLALDKLVGKFTSDEEATEEEVPQTWATFVQGNDQFSMSYPDTFRIAKKMDGSTVQFLDEGEIHTEVHVVTDTDRLDRGLWLSSLPVEAAKLGGRPCKRYTTKVADGDRLVPTISYVAPYGEKLVGVSFRVRDDRLDPIQQRMLDTFRFDEALPATAP